jgi:hypothetical protein
MKHSKVGREIRNTRLLVRDLVEVILSNQLHPHVRPRLTEVVQFLQVYCRLAELEIAAGERPQPGSVSFPEGTKEQVQEWVEDEEVMEREKEELVEDLSQAMKAYGYDPTPIRGVMGL